MCNSPSRPFSSEPAVPGDEEEAAAAASPEPEPEVEKEVEAAVVELKPETMPETQTDAHTTDDQTEKSPTAAPPTAEPAAVPAEPAPAAPEENRVGLNLTTSCFILLTQINWIKCNNTLNVSCVVTSYSRSPGHQSPVRTSLPVGPSQSQESPHTSSKPLPQHRYVCHHLIGVKSWNV